MIIQGSENSTLHVSRHEDMDKYLVLVEKYMSEGFHKSAKLFIDKIHSFEDGTHSLEISGVHYAVCEDVDFFSMANRIAKSRNYRKYKTALQAAA